MNKEKKTGAAYIRVSTHGKQEELSPDAQKRLIRDYAKKNNISVNESILILEKNNIQRGLDEFFKKNR